MHKTEISLELYRILKDWFATNYTVGIDHDLQQISLAMHKTEISLELYRILKDWFATNYTVGLRRLLQTELFRNSQQIKLFRSAELNGYLLQPVEYPLLQWYSTV